jgi:chloramphenicol 3-O phosphotransferase
VSGRVIVLNGTSSSGKTSLGRALQDSLPDVWLLFGIDTLIGALPWRLYGTDDGHVIHEDGSIDIGAVFLAEQARWRQGVAAMVRGGSNVIIDEVLLRGGDEQAEWRTILEGLGVTWVGVRSDIDVAAERERARGDRSIGMARAQAANVHVGVTYDVEVDTTSTPPDVLAAQLQLG